VRGLAKTRTIVTRAAFLQVHCGVQPEELLLLAFNKQAAEEIKARLAPLVGSRLPHVMTFHALAYALVHPEGELLFDDIGADQFGYSREIQEIIDAHLRSPKHEELIKEIMLAHFREDWERIVDGRFELRMEDLLAYRRDLPRESLRGEYVKSHGEKVIANILFEHAIEYKYEPNFFWNGVNYRPDFGINTGPNRGVVLEYFGLEGDPDYDAMSQAKREYWRARSDWTLLEFTPADLVRANGRLTEILLGELLNAGVQWRRRSEEEIWALVRARALDHFTAAMKTFVGRCRKLNVSCDDLRQRTGRHTPASRAEGLFLKVGNSIYDQYLRELAKRGKDDFDGLMWGATSVIHQGQTRFQRNRGKEQGNLAHLRYVMVDEFQDFSQMFLEMANAIRQVNRGVQFFCSGMTADGKPHYAECRHSERG
jgi:DNA helicase IV